MLGMVLAVDVCYDYCVNTCSINPCTKRIFLNQWCSMHYARWKRHGNPLILKKERHGKNKSSEYHAWQNLKARCVNPNNPRYKHYGGRGIKVCDRWLNSFANFYEDMGDKPTSHHSIDRINNDGNYEPENCRWATNSQQNLNRQLSKHNKSGRRGVRYYKAYGKWMAYITKDYEQKFLGYYDNYEDAVKARQKAEVRYVT